MGDASANAGGTVKLIGSSVGGAVTADNGTIETENTNVVNGASVLNGGKLKLKTEPFPAVSKRMPDLQLMLLWIGPEML